MEEVQILISKMDDLSKRLARIEEILLNKVADVEPSSHPQSPQTLIKGIDRLSKELNLDQSIINNYFYFSDNDVRLLFSFNDSKEAQKQIKATLVILTIYYYLFGKESIDSKSLNQKLKNLGIGSLAKISENFSRHRQLFIPQGKQGSNSFQYRITVPGLKEGILTIQSVIKENQKEKG